MNAMSRKTVMPARALPHGPTGLCGVLRACDNARMDDNHKPERFQFGLGKLFKATALVAVVTAIGSALPTDYLFFSFAFLVASAAIPYFAFWILFQD
jgi:hypothetical protein